MKKTFLTFIIAITSIAAVTSIYLATLEDPTDIQEQLSATTNTIAAAGTTALFGLLDDERDDSDLT